MNFPAKSASFAIGVLSLGAETLWIRLFSFIGRSTPLAVSVILGTYLLGIAFGAVLGARLCRIQDRNQLTETLILSLLTASSIILASSLIIVGVAMGASGHFNAIVLQGIIALVLAFLPAFIFSICFPICHHLGTTIVAGKTGKGLSRVYAANIAGSVIGPLLVNFVILHFVTTESAFAILGLLGIGVSALLLGVEAPRPKLKLASALCFVLGLANVAALADSDNWLIRSLAAKPPSKAEISRIIETRQGIITSYKDEKLGDIIYGGNVYDGRANVDPRLNSNKINRVMVSAALRPNPKRVLEIGLSVGSWNYLITGFPGVKQIDVVEINPGYLTLLDEYPLQKAAMEDPRVRLHIGDGRKFLRNSPEGTYDLVIMNNTFHWRAYASLLLSSEFLHLVRSRMTPNGILAFNATASPDALLTAASVFPHAYLYGGFAICAEFDWRAVLERPESVRELARISPLRKPLFTDADRGLLEGFLSRAHTATLDDLSVKVGRPLEVITDRNLITEFRYGRPLKPSDTAE